MAEDTLFRNSQFQAQQASEGRQYTYEGLTRMLPGAASMAQGILGIAGQRQDMQLRQQRALMEGARHEAELQEFQIRADTYRSELELRQMAAATRRMELDYKQAELSMGQQLRELELTQARGKIASQGPIEMPGGAFGVFNPITGRYQETDENDPAVRAMLGARARHAEREDAEVLHTRAQTRRALRNDENQLAIAANVRQLGNLANEAQRRIALDPENAAAQSEYEEYKAALFREIRRGAGSGEGDAIGAIAEGLQVPAEQVEEALMQVASSYMTASGGQVDVSRVIDAILVNRDPAILEKLREFIASSPR